MRDLRRPQEEERDREIDRKREREKERKIASSDGFFVASAHLLLLAFFLASDIHPLLFLLPLLLCFRLNHHLAGAGAAIYSVIRFSMATSLEMREFTPGKLIKDDY